MDFGVVLTYISIVIAVYALSPEYLKLKLKLAWNPFFIIFFLTGILLFLFSFDSILYSSHIVNVKEHIERFFCINIKEDIYRLLLWLIQIGTILWIIWTWYFRQGNINRFNKIVKLLFNWKEYGKLFNLLDANINRLFKYSYKEEKLRKFIRQYDYRVNLFAFHNPPKKKNIINRFIGWFLIDLLKLDIDYSHSFLLDEILDYDIIEKIARSNEMLWFSFMKNFVKYEGFNELEQFSSKFLPIILSNPNSIVSYQMKEMQREWWNITKEYIKFLIDNSDKIKLEKNIDVTVSDIFKDETNKKLLNEPYSPGNDVYYKNAKIVWQILYLLQIYLKIDPDKLMLGNTLRYVCRELLDNTDRSWDKWVDNIEHNTGTAYLIHELFDVYEKLCVKRPEYIDNYFSSLMGYVLSDKKVDEELKQNLVNSSFYFICNRNEDNKNIKNEIKKVLKRFLANNRRLLPYFDLNMHDRITHYHDTGSKDIFAIIDWMK